MTSATPEKETDEPRFVIDAEAAKLLGLSVYKVAHLRSIGRIPYLPGKPNLMERSDVLAFKRLEEAPKSIAEIKQDARRWVEQLIFKRTVLSRTKRQ